VAENYQAAEAGGLDHVAESNATAVRPAGNETFVEAASRCDVAAMLLPSGLQSTQAMLRLLLVKPSIYRKAAVREGSRPALHWRDFMQC